MWGLGVLKRTALFAFMAPNSNKKESCNATPALSMLLPSNVAVLQYMYVPDVLEKRGPHREGHLKLAADMIAAGMCLAGGPHTAAVATESAVEMGMPTPTGAYFLFTDATAASAFVEHDPYVAAGIVAKHSILSWNVVVQKES
jgi:uncharacterized protein